MTTSDTATAPALARTEIRHRVLALCAETDAITCRPTALGRSNLLHNKVLNQASTSWNLRTSLATLHSAKLISWHYERGTQYADATPEGIATLHRWDAELLGGGE